MGSTVISVVTYKTDGDVTRIRFCLKTRLTRKGGQSQNLDFAWFDTTVEHWTSFSALPDSQLTTWYKDITSLLYQTLDRDVRHVDCMLLRQGFDHIALNHADGWKTPRQMSAREGIALIAKIMTQPELAEHNKALLPADRVEQCPICFESYEGEPKHAVMLPCSSKHCICYECFENVSKVNGLSETVCPYCRTQVAPDDLAVRMVPNYLDVDAPFTYDARYTGFENKERTYAVIDRVLPLTSHEGILVDKDVFVESWNLVVATGFFEDDTPDHLDHVKAPETWYLFKSFLDTVREIDNTTLAVATIYRLLRQNALKAMRTQYLANGMGAYLSPEDLERLLADEGGLYLRLGYYEFIAKVLNRVIQLPIRRACYEHREHITETNPTGKHVHGDVVFWCPKDGAITSYRPRYIPASEDEDEGDDDGDDSSAIIRVEAIADVA